MAISKQKIIKWFNMLRGNSIYHVNQEIGKIYSVEKLKGYYNDLTEKVTRGGEIPSNKVPTTVVDGGEEIIFPIAVFQYGLGAYDLYLLNEEPKFFEKIKTCADWAVNNQENNGAWSTFFFENQEHPYSSMAQGEGVSLLLRAYKIIDDKKYLESAKKAIEFMLLPISKGGTTKYVGEDIYLYECTHDPLILNGWIFSLWGLYDYYKYTQNAEIQKVLNTTLLSLKKKLPEFDIKYWSNYEEGGQRISSPFYHKLHIAQFRVMHELFGDSIYKEYADIWEKYQNSFWKSKVAFVKKVLQKVFEK